ncbi:hypothetical protein [Nocardia sp. NPDC020380]|uniref:hypothetical protein n=1 Tax=Nocardia sp. NPDC020380 TaxID=3364309 RepID=UPI0037976AB0
MTIIGVPAETAARERRVALTPVDVARLSAAGFRVVVEQSAGWRADFTDAAYRKAGAVVVTGPAAVFDLADIVAWVKPPAYELDSMPLRRGQLLVGFQDPVYRAAGIAELRARGVESIAFEQLSPTRDDLAAAPPHAAGGDDRVPGARLASDTAQAAARLAPGAGPVAADPLPRGGHLGGGSADSVLGDGRLATGGGHLAPRVDPMSVMSMIAGDVAYQEGRALLRKEVGARRVRTLVLGPGKAGLAAVGAAVAGGDEPPIVLGRRPDQSVVATRHGAGEFRVGPDAAAVTEIIATTHPDLIICAAGRGSRAPVLLDESGLRALAPGAVVVDLAKKAGGNCVETRADDTVELTNGVRVTHRSNYPASRPHAASKAYGAAVAALLPELARALVPETPIGHSRRFADLAARGGSIPEWTFAEPLMASYQN